MDKNKCTNNKAYERGEQTRKEIYDDVYNQLRTMFDLGIPETSETGNCNRAIRVPGYEFKEAVK